MPNLPKDKCIADIVAASGDVLSRQRASKILDEIKEMTKSQKLGGEDVIPQEFLNQYKNRRINQMKSEVLQAERETLLNHRAKQGIMDYVSKWDNPAKGLMAFLGGRMEMKFGSRANVGAYINALQNKVIQGTIDKLEAAGLYKVATSGKMDLDIVRAMWGQQATKQAMKIAEIIKESQGYVVKRLNAAGDNVQIRPEYVFRQAHDRDLLRKAGKDKWIKTIKPLLDENRTFRDEFVEDVDKFLGDSYDALVTGVHLKPEPEKNMRKLHFKDGDSFYKYHKEFANGNVMENIYYGLNNSARTAALMENLGPGRRANFDDIINQISEKYRTPEVLDTINGMLENPENIFATLNGELSSPKNHTLAKYAGGIRAVTSMSKLGMALVASLTDTANTTSGLLYRNKGVMRSFFAPFNGLFKFGQSADEMFIVAKKAGLAIESENAQNHAALDITDGPTMHNLNRLQTIFYKLTGLPAWTDRLKANAVNLLSNDFAEAAERSFDDMVKDVGFQRDFTKFGITSDIWDAWRNGVQKVGDNKFLFPDQIRNADKSLIAKIAKDEYGITVKSDESMEMVLDRLETKLRAYYVDSADELVLTPGVRERAILNFGSKAGTVNGEIIRMFSQFKAFPVTYLTKGIGRELSRDSKTEAAMGMAQFLAYSTALGYVSMTIRDFLKGKTPKPIFDEDTFLNPKTLASAMVSGGGAGIFTDAIFNDYGYGRSFVSSTAGPVLGQLDDLQKLYSKAVRGEDVASELINFGKSNMPFYNLPTKPVLDYLFIYGMQELANPGYLRRMEHRAKYEQGQEFLFPPSQNAVQF